MRNRKQRRQKAILPLKVLVSVDGKNHLAHTLDISASGARIVLTNRIIPGTSITIEFKHRRAAGTAVWCKPLGDSKYDHEIGIRLNNANSNFWGIHLAMNEPDAPEHEAAIPFSEFMNSLSNQP